MWDRDDERKAQRVGSALVVSQSSVPPYGQRRGWVPRREEDYGGQLDNSDYNIYFSVFYGIDIQHTFCGKQT